MSLGNKYLDVSLGKIILLGKGVLLGTIFSSIENPLLSKIPFFVSPSFLSELLLILIIIFGLFFLLSS